MIPPLLPDNHPLLRQTMPAFDFNAADARVTATAISNTLLAAMMHYDGIGLAANQIGLEERVFAIQLEDGKRVVMFNPLMTWLSTESVVCNEGCLTFGPDLQLSISRPKECQIAYDDTQGVRRVLDLKGIDARCALHEIDHLDGVLFTSHVSKLKLDMAKKKARKKA